MKFTHYDEVSGEKLPYGYGIAYEDYSSMTYTAFPVPYNIIVRVSRRLSFILQRKAFKADQRRNVKRFERALDRAWFRMRVQPNLGAVVARALRRRPEAVRKCVESANAVLAAYRDKALGH